MMTDSAITDGQPPPDLLFVGTYNQPVPFPSSRGEGIHVFRVDRGTGRLQALQVVSGLQNPSFLAIHPGGRHLYAVSEVETGQVTSLRIDRASGRVSILNQVATGGSGPAHVTVDASGRHLIVANYVSGHWSLIRVEPDGRLGPLVDLRHSSGSGPNTDRQASAHAHMALADPLSPVVLGCDLGIDRVMVWGLDADAGRLVPGTPPSWQVDAGSGPRHLALHATLSRVYVLRELDSTISVFAFDRNRRALLAMQAVSTLPDWFNGDSTAAHVEVHPSGRFLYASNRGHDSIAAFAIEPATGRLRLAGHTATQGKTPRAFSILPNGRFLYVGNQDADTVVTFAVDSRTGALAPVDAVIPVSSPACLAFTSFSPAPSPSGTMEAGLSATDRRAGMLAIEHSLAGPVRSAGALMHHEAKHGAVPALHAAALGQHGGHAR